MNANNYSHRETPSIGALDAMRVFWGGKWFVLSAAVICAALAGLAAWFKPNQYVAETILLPVTNAASGGQMGALSSMASQLGGLASLAGISSGGDSRKSESIAVLQSEALTEKFIRENGLLSILYAKKWNFANKSWIDPDPKNVPTLWKANRDFKKIRTVVSDTKTGLVTVTITWSNAQVAARWANEIVKLTNDHLRTLAIEESERDITFLNDQAAKTSVLEARQAIYRLLETEINKVMLARGSNEYAFKVLDPAVAPEKPSNLPLFAWVVVGFIAGVFLPLPLLLLRARAAADRAV